MEYGLKTIEEEAIKLTDFFLGGGGGGGATRRESDRERESGCVSRPS